MRVSSAIAPFVAACVVWDESNNKANDNIIVHVNSAILTDKEDFQPASLDFGVRTTGPKTLNTSYKTSSHSLNGAVDIWRILIG